MAFIFFDKLTFVFGLITVKHSHLSFGLVLRCTVYQMLKNIVLAVNERIVARKRPFGKYDRLTCVFAILVNTMIRKRIATNDIA
jgi:hypothetical protein